ncbi:hypothetical protein WAI453_001810 [Rhynchosporium graminicola]
MDPSFNRDMNDFHSPGLNQPTLDGAQRQNAGPRDESSQNQTAGQNMGTNRTFYGPDASTGDNRVDEARMDGSEHETNNDRPSEQNHKPQALEKMGGMGPRDQQPLMGSMTDDEATPRAADQVSHHPYPDLSLPHPSLQLDFRMAVKLSPRISLGPTPFGHRNWISFTGGTWSGSWGSGIALPGGQDSQLIIGDGSAHLQTNYILQTYDEPPAHIVVKTHGWRTGPPEVLAQLANPDTADAVDPNSYKFRLFIDMETGDERYRDKVNCGMWVGSGMRKGAEVIYDAYRVS